MRKSSQIQKVSMIIAVIILMILAIFMIQEIPVMQNDARIINFAGRTRGNTQRLIKQELQGHENDLLIDMMDSILQELLTGNGENNLVKLDDINYLSKLEVQIEAWEKLKKEIYIYRGDFSNSETLYQLSEVYYEIADDTVDAAEIFSAKNTALINKIEVLIIIGSIFIIAVIFWMSYDLIHLVRKNRHLNNMAYIDVLTGLPNRSYCERKIEEIGLIQKGVEGCCLMLDLNNLKVTNDTLGHQAGDELIKNFAHAIKASIPDKMFIGRYGGDEFVGMAKNMTESEVLKFINILDDNVDKQNQQEKDYKISYALGYAMASSFEEITLKRLLEQADINMYKRKVDMKKQI